MTQVTPFIDYTCLQGDVMATVMGLCPPNTAELICLRPLVHFNHHSSELTLWGGRSIIVPFDPDSMDAFSHGLLFLWQNFCCGFWAFLHVFSQTDGAVTNFLLIVTCNIKLGLEVISLFFLFQL